MLGDSPDHVDVAGSWVRAALSTTELVHVLQTNKQALDKISRVLRLRLQLDGAVCVAWDCLQNS